MEKNREYYESLDKRTREYKEWKAKQSEGLGDTVEKITKATGIKKMVDWFAEKTGVDCGCDKRKQYLNEKFRYKAECMVKSEYEWWTEYLKRHNPDNFTKQDVYEIYRLYMRLFKVRPRICQNCPSGVTTMRQLVKDINVIYKSYV